MLKRVLTSVMLPIVVASSTEDDGAILELTGNQPRIHWGDPVNPNCKIVMDDGLPLTWVDFFLHLFLMVETGATELAWAMMSGCGRGSVSSMRGRGGSDGSQPRQRPARVAFSCV